MTPEHKEQIRERWKIEARHGLPYSVVELARKDIQLLLAANDELEKRLKELEEAFIGETSMLRAIRYSMDHADKPFPSLEKITQHIERLETALHK